MPATPLFADYTLPSVPAPNVFTETSLPKVDAATGAFTLSVPLDIPPGRNSLQPDLTLDYNSQRTQDSIVGYGWQLSIPYIQRLNKTGSQNLFSGGYFTSSIDGELVSLATSTPATSTPTILDSLPVTYRTLSSGTSDSFPYTVPSGGTNKELIVQVCMNAGSGGAPSATQNGASITFTKISGDVERCYHWYGVLPNPTSGAFSISWPSGSVQYSVMTLANVDQTSPVDVASVSAVHAPTHATIISTSITTTAGNDLLLDEAVGSIPGTTQTYGSGQTETHSGGNYDPFGQESGSSKPAASSAGTETMTRSFSPADGGLDLAVIGVKPAIVLITPASTYYAARVDNGSNNSYSFVNNTWTVYDKHGTRYLYKIASSKVTAPPRGR
jgi:hypothetical protein